MRGVRDTVQRIFLFSLRQFRGVKSWIAPPAPSATQESAKCPGIEVSVPFGRHSAGELESAVRDRQGRGAHTRGGSATICSEAVRRRGTRRSKIKIPVTGRAGFTRGPHPE